MLIAPSIEGVSDGDAATLDPEGGVLRLAANDTDIPLEPMPENLRAIIEDGGLVPHLKKRFAAERKGPGA